MERDPYVSDEYVAEFERELEKSIEELVDDYQYIPYVCIVNLLQNQVNKYLKKSNEQ